MALSYISATTVAATSIASMPTHQAGDLLVIWAYRTGSTSAPTIPAGWTSINSGTGGGGSNNSYALAYKVAASSSETSGTWTNATFLQCQVFRGAQLGTPVGTSSIPTGLTSGTSIAIPALTLQVTNGSSFIAAFYGHRSNFTAPTTTQGVLVQRSAINSASGTVSGYSTASPVSGFAGQSISITATSSNYIPAALEIRAQPDTRYFLIT